jgi:hypothetical protein
MYSAFLRCDVPGILVHLDDDIIWIVAGSSAVPMAGVRKGLTEVRQFFETVEKMLEIRLFEPTILKTPRLLPCRFATATMGRPPFGPRYPSTAPSGQLQTTVPKCQGYSLFRKPCRSPALHPPTNRERGISLSFLGSPGTVAGHFQKRLLADVSRNSLQPDCYYARREQPKPASKFCPGSDVNLTVGNGRSADPAAR